MVSEKVVGRLTLYRRIVGEFLQEGTSNLHSHELAAEAGVSAAQVRRDFMLLGYEGSPKHGYKCELLLKALSTFLDEPGGQKVALVGVGNLGRAILSYFGSQKPHVSIVAAFDVDEMKTGRVIQGCRCYAVDMLEQTISESQIRVAIIAVPAAEAQNIADRLIASGVSALVNFAPVHLHVPAHVYVEKVDVTMALEKAAYFARKTN